MQYSDDDILINEFKIISSLDKLTKEQLKDLVKFYLGQTTNLYKQNRQLITDKLLTPPSESFIIL